MSAFLTFQLEYTFVL